MTASVPASTPSALDALPRRGNLASRTIARTVLAVLGWRIQGALPNVARMVLIGAPHTSNWDFVIGIATAWALSVRVTWFGKQELFRRPFSVFFRWLGGIPVDRHVSTGFVEQTVAALQSRERFMLAIAPEGTRRAVTKWRTGFYYIAMGTQVPIVLVTFDRARRLMHLGPALTPSGDLEADLARIRALYDGILAATPAEAAPR
jgi:1-acyl-sn-glycerol-3-phosphate acyltransferase